MLCRRLARTYPVPPAGTSGPIQLVASSFCLFHLRPDLLNSFWRLLSRLACSQMPSLKRLHLAKRRIQVNYYFYCGYLKTVLKAFMVFSLHCKYIGSNPAACLATHPLLTGYMGSGSPFLPQSWGKQSPGRLLQMH